MESDARPVALAFAGAVVGGFAFSIAALAADALGMLFTGAMTAYCALEFVTRASIPIDR